MDEWQYKPAQDRDVPGGGRWQSLQREAGLLSFVAQGLWRSVARTYLLLYHRLTIQGAEHIPASAPFVLVANHSSHLDALTLAAALPWKLRQRAFPIAAGDVFFQTKASAFFSALALNALPLWRKRCGSHALEDLRARLVGEPAIYILFPEGTRTRDGKMGPFKPGVGRLVAGSAAPVVPCYLDGAFDAMPPEGKLPVPTKLTLRIGPPLDFSALPNERSSWEKISVDLEAAVRGLAAGASKQAQ